MVAWIISFPRYKATFLLSAPPISLPWARYHVLNRGTRKQGHSTFWLRLAHSDVHATTVDLLIPRLPQREWSDCSLLRASNEHSLIVRVLRARRTVCLLPRLILGMRGGQRSLDELACHRIARRPNNDPFPLRHDAERRFGANPAREEPRKLSPDRRMGHAYYAWPVPSASSYSSMSCSSSSSSAGRTF